MTPTDASRQRDLIRALRDQSAHAGRLPSDDLAARIIAQVPTRRAIRFPWIPAAVAVAAGLAIATTMALLSNETSAPPAPAVAQQPPLPVTAPLPIDWTLLLAGPQQRIDGELAALRADGRHLIDLIDEAASPLRAAVRLGEP